MRTDTNSLDGTTPDRECTTTGSFEDHGLADGSELIRGTYYRLADGGVDEFVPTEEFFDQLEAAFVWEYLGTVQESAVPDHVRAAIDDAMAWTVEEFADEPDADLRTDVLPAFYRRVTDFHCAYRD